MIPPFPTSGPHIWRSERQLVCGCFQALRLLMDATDRQRWGSPCWCSSWEDMDAGVSSLLSHYFQWKKVETWCLWELLSVCHTGMKLAKGINVMWALPTDRGEMAAETKLKYGRTERHSWGNHFHFTNYPSPQSTDQSESLGLNLAVRSMPCPCNPPVPVSSNKGKSTWAFLCKSLEGRFPAPGGAGIHVHGLGKRLHVKA